MGWKGREEAGGGGGRQISNSDFLPEACEQMWPRETAAPLVDAR